MANATMIAVDPPPPPQTSDVYEGSCLDVPPLDLDFFSENDGVDEDDFDWELYFNIDDLDELPVHGDSQALPDANFEQLNAIIESFSSELRGDVEFSGYQISDFSVNIGISDGSVKLCSFPEIGYQDDVKKMNLSSADSLGGLKILNCNSPESKDSGNCNSTVANSTNDSFLSEVLVDQKVKNGVDGSLLKRKKDGLCNVEYRVNKCRKSNYHEGNDKSDGLIEDKEKMKARLMRNRESAQLSRQRKKHYVEELEGKVKTMYSTIQGLNARVSQIIAENSALRQQLSCRVGGTVPNPYAPPPPPPGMHPYSGMMYPWMPYFAPPYVVKQGSQVPLVPIPKLKSHGQGNKEIGKNVGKRTKKVAGVSILGLLFFIMLFGLLVPMFNVRYGGVRESLSDGGSYVGAGLDEKHHGRVLMVNGTSLSDGSVKGCVHCGYGSIGKCFVDEFSGHRNENESLVASLYVPRNDKLVKIDGNLIIHSVLASEKAISSHSMGSGENSLALPGDLAPTLPVPGRNGDRYSHLRTSGSVSANDGINVKKLTDSPLQQWFLEGLAGPMMRSGMCTEVFQFDVSAASTNGAVVPATRNISEQNSTRLHDKRRNRRILHGIPIPLTGTSDNNISTRRNSEKEKLNSNSSLPPMVVSVLVDPKEMGDADLDGVMGTKSISRVFVVVLIDSIKHVTYSCMLPFKGTANHLVTS